MKRKQTQKKSTTLTDVAQHVGVTPMTVSRVVNESGYVSTQTRSKVLRAIKEMKYRRNGLARGLKIQRTETIGLVLGDISNPYSTELARAIRETLLLRGYSLFICISEHNSAEDVSALESLANHSVDGIIVATRSNEGGDRYLDQIAGSDFPIVAIGRDYKHDSVDNISADNLRGGFAATQHLIDLGHKRIGFIGATLRGDSNLKRLQGYLNAFEIHGIEVDERLITGRNDSNSDIPGYSTEKIGYEGMKRLLSLPKRPTAVFARNDFTAIGAMNAIMDAGLKIPDDVAIVGFDDIPMATHTNPPLTTVRQPMRQEGRLAVEMLLERIEEKEPISRREHMLNCELIVRDSTVSKIV